MLYYNKIEDLRIVKKISQGKLASKIGMSREGYSRMLKDKTMKVSILEAIADFLDVPITAFFTESKPNQETLKEYPLPDKMGMVNENNTINPNYMNRLIESKDRIIAMQDEKIEELKIRLAAFENGNDLSKDAG